VTVAVPPTLVWTASTDPADLGGYAQIDFGWLKRDVVAAARSAGRQRTTLANPAQQWLERVRGLDALAVTGVTLTPLDELAALHGYVLEPAWRAGVRLLIESPQKLTKLDPRDFVDPGFEHGLHAGARTARRDADLARRRPGVRGGRARTAVSPAGR
jgi:hypothetical protein